MNVPSGPNLPYPPQQRRPKKTHGCLWSLFGGFLGMVVLIVAVAAIASSGSDGGSGDGGNDGAKPKAVDATSKSHKGGHKADQTSDKTHATFTVKGSSAKGVDITYGSDSDNRQGKGDSLPWHANLPVDDSGDTMFYQVTAQLSGGGDITCTVKIGDQVKTGHASGGYNICSAQLNGDPFGGWS